MRIKMSSRCVDESMYENGKSWFEGDREELVRIVCCLGGIKEIEKIEIEIGCEKVIFDVESGGDFFDNVFGKLDYDGSLLGLREGEKDKSIFNFVRFSWDLRMLDNSDERYVWKKRILVCMDDGKVRGGNRKECGEIVKELGGLEKVVEIMEDGDLWKKKICEGGIYFVKEDFRCYDENLDIID